MLRCFIAFVLILPSISVSASEHCAGVEALDALYGVRELVIRGASSYIVSSEIDEHVEALREPLPGGGYRWVRLVRPSEDYGPYERERHFVRSASESSPDMFEAETTNAWAVVIAVPRKRSIFRKNAESWIGDVTITCATEGRTETHRESIRRWMQPDTTHTIDIDGIADQCRVRVETVTRPDHLDERALVEIHIREAVDEDDPANPGYDTIRMLQRVRRDATPATLDREIAKLEHSLFPNLYSYPFTTLLFETREARRLLGSDDEEDRAKGHEMLESVVERMEEK